MHIGQQAEFIAETMLDESLSSTAQPLDFSRFPRLPCPTTLPGCPR